MWNCYLLTYSALCFQILSKIDGVLNDMKPDMNNHIIFLMDDLSSYPPFLLGFDNTSDESSGADIFAVPYDFSIWERIQMKVSDFLSS
jgi:hypothetical protein